MPSSTSIFSHEKLWVLSDKVYTISMQYEVWNMSIINALTMDIQGYPTWSLHPLCTYTTYIITMTSSTSTSSHLNVIININIISSQYHHQHHLISIPSSTWQAIAFHIHTYKFMPGIHIPQVIRQHKPYTKTIHNITRMIF